MSKIKDFFKTLKTINSRQLKFFVLVIIMIVVIAGFSVYLLGFLISNINEALLSGGKKEKTAVEFAIERFEKLNIKR
jgi:hypothetical protein